MVPIIFVHYGASWFLEPVFECARKFNPETPIILLGEGMNQEIAKKHDITYFPFKDFHTDQSRKFIQEYKHVGTTEGEDQRKHCICFVRWTLMEEFMKKHGVESAWYFDSDTLICQNLEKVYPWYLSKAYWISNRISGCNTLVINRRILGHLNDIIFQKMNDQDFIDGKKRALEKRIQEGGQYNLCDMSCIGEFSKTPMVGDLTDIVQGCTFDPNINLDTADQRFNENYPYYFEMMNFSGRPRPVKKIFYQKEAGVTYPYCSMYQKDSPEKKMIRMLTLNMSWLTEKQLYMIYNPIKRGV